MSLQDTVLDIVKDMGPLLPAEIVSEVSKRTGQQRDMFFIGAVLSELISAGNVKMSHAKIGGSRLYYFQGQEEKLSKLYDYLNDKEKKAYDLLVENKVLRGAEQEPAIRVALSQLKDFSKPIEVKLKETETFWRWHLFPIEEAKKSIKEIVSKEIDALRDEGKSKTPEMEAKPTRHEEPIVQQPSAEHRQEKPKEKQKNEEATGGFIAPQPKAHEKQAKLSDTSDVDDDDFGKNAKDFLISKKARILSGNILKKSSECEFEVEAESALGVIRMYVFAKSKKKLNETDLGYAYVRAKNRNLELCFLSPGELTKKAKDMLDDELKSIVFLKMG